MYRPQREDNSSGWCRRVVTSTWNCCEAFCQQTSIHGFNHIAAPKRHWFERLVWVAVTGAAVWGVADVSLGQWQRYRDSPTVVTLQKDFRTWHYTMLAVTACEKNRTSEEKARPAIKSRWNVGPNDTKYGHYFRFVDMVANSDLYHLHGYEEFANYSDLNVDLFELAVEVMPEQRVKLSVEGQIARPPKWVPVMTEAGACHTLNSVAVADVALINLTSNYTRDVPVTCKYSAQGCYYILESFHEMDYYIHSAYDIPDTLTTPYTSYKSLSSFTELSTTETRAGPGVRALSPRRRYCHFTDEPTEPNRRVCTAPYTSYESLSSFTELSTTETRAGPGVRALSPRRRYCHFTDEPTEPNRRVCTAPYTSYESLSSFTELSTTETRAGPGVRALSPRRRYCHFTDEPTEPNRRVCTAPYTSYESLSSFTELSTTETRAGPGVRALSPRRRYCHFTDEPTEPNRRVHSTNICRQGCKSRIAVKLCGCKPFYYFFAEGPLCGAAGMRCLSGAAHRLATFDNTKCPCVQQCRDSVFREITTEAQIWDRGPLLLRGLVRFTVQPPRMRYARSIVFHFQDLVVSFGGAAGLFLGASFISFVEVASFCLQRLLAPRAKRTDHKPVVKPPTKPYEHRIQELNMILRRNTYERDYAFP